MWVGDETMFGTETKAPIVTCPGCDESMKVIERKPIGFSNGLVDVRYVCETCLTHTIRTIKPDDRGLL
jgi:C4-type Zn-finger protein